MTKRILSLLLFFALSLSLALPVRAAGPLPFTDLAEKHWAYSYVKELYDAGVVNGTTDTTFSPQGNVTLGQALKLILLAAGYGEQAPTKEHWASGYYSLAWKEGMLGSASEMGPDQKVSRVQIAEIAAKALDCQRTGHGRSPFADTVNPYVLALSDNGIFNGIQEGDLLVFKPKNTITRAEISAVICRILEWKKAHPEPPGQEDVPAEQPQEQSETPTPETPAEPTPVAPTPTQPATPEPEPEPVPAFSYSHTPDGYITWRGSRVPVWNSTDRNPYDPSAFSYNGNGFLTYNDGTYTSRIGIDVSKHQGTINWAKVKEAGVDFAILRLGYRGYSTGKLVMDSTFYTNLQGCLDNGIEVGVYFFSQALNYKEGVAEANFVMDALSGYRITYPIVFDWEPYAASVGARTRGIGDEQLNQAAQGFLETVAKAGQTGMLYQNPTYFYKHMDMSRFADYPLWLAHYVDMTSFYYRYDIWQYSCTGHVSGIDGNVDLNIHILPKQ